MSLNKFNNTNIKNQDKEFIEFINNEKEKVKKLIGSSILFTSSLILNSSSVINEKNYDSNINFSTITGKITNHKYPHISSSVETMSLEEVRDFMNFYSIEKKDDKKFVFKVISIQISAGLPVTGILDNKTYDYFLRIKEEKNKKSNNEKTIKIFRNFKYEKINFSSEKIEITKKYIGTEELENFINIFGIKSGDEFEEKVSEIQAKFELRNLKIL